MSKPLAVDLFCGLGGWTAGLLDAGYRVRGYDIEAHEYGDEKYPAELVLQNVMTLNGADLASDPALALIVASPPCQAYSYMAMPWSLAKAKAAAIRADDTGAERERLNALFNACFRIQREASEAAGRHIPMVVENVRGAQPWVGRAGWNYGSYYLWGDIPGSMPRVAGGGGRARQKSHPGEQWNTSRKNFTGTLGWDHSERADDGRKVPGFRFDGSGKSFQTASVNLGLAPSDGFKTKGMDWNNRALRGQDFTRIAGAQHEAGIKGSEGYERDHPNAFGWKQPCTSSHSKARKAASAKIAKIPLTLSRHVANYYHPDAPSFHAPREVWREVDLFGERL